MICSQWMVFLIFAIQMIQKTFVDLYLNFIWLGRRRIRVLLVCCIIVMLFSIDVSILVKILSLMWFTTFTPCILWIIFLLNAAFLSLISFALFNFFRWTGNGLLIVTASQQRFLFSMLIRFDQLQVVICRQRRRILQIFFHTWFDLLLLLWHGFLLVQWKTAQLQLG